MKNPDDDNQCCNNQADGERSASSQKRKVIDHISAIVDATLLPTSSDQDTSSIEAATISRLPSGCVLAAHDDVHLHPQHTCSAVGKTDIDGTRVQSQQGCVGNSVGISTANIPQNTLSDGCNVVGKVYTGVGGCAGSQADQETTVLHILGIASADVPKTAWSSECESDSVSEDHVPDDIQTYKKTTVNGFANYNNNNNMEKHRADWSESKLKKSRRLDADGMRLRSACVCYRPPCIDKILLVSSTRHRDRWVFPGGGIETDETAEDAAVRETMEEAGVSGHVVDSLGSFDHLESAQRCAVFLLAVDSEFSEWQEQKNNGRRRQWFTISEARANIQLHKPWQLPYMDALSKYMSRRQNQQK